MARITERDAAVARKILVALARIRAEKPRDAKLARRVLSGTLKVNFDTVHIESGVKRHLFDKPTSLYVKEHRAIAAAMAERGKVVPLRKQLDDVRKRLRTSETQLQRSRDYAALLLIRMQKLDLEIARLNEELAQGPLGEETPLIGTGRVTAMPPVQRGPRPGRKVGKPQPRRGVGR